MEKPEIPVPIPPQPEPATFEEQAFVMRGVVARKDKSPKKLTKSPAKSPGPSLANSGSGPHHQPIVSPMMPTRGSMGNYILLLLFA